MTPDTEFDHEQVRRPEDVDVDRDKTVFDPETGEWMTIEQVNEMAETYAEDRFMERLATSPVSVDRSPSTDSTDERSDPFWKRFLDRLNWDDEKEGTDEEVETVFDPETGEWMTIEDTRRRAALYASEGDTDTGVGLLEDDVGKKVIAAIHDGRMIGRVVRVEEGQAYVKIRMGSPSMRFGDLPVGELLLDDPRGEALSSRHFPDHEIYRISPAFVSHITDNVIHLKSFEADVETSRN
ncbi:hypothetical protein HTZ84_21235 [Haloterrigena sp. SYSU A558-1]|uniref:Uncharacterized protein n=1 Tax=Haloterrigena gelatinilytica TaxID=2741724 RepID=A0ABX2LJP3_9EURY|nr:hypothetical protein [Haloterrigena gelatinilytica]NUC74790.1 hypothetical protein [Haloterrigena gelatinilytica]